MELKSLKLYLHRYRNQGIFYEMAVNTILDDFVASCQPRSCQVVGEFTARGGLTTSVSCFYEADYDSNVMVPRRPKGADRQT